MPKTKYQSNEGEIHQITMSADRIAVAGAAPTGDATTSIKATVSKTNRTHGIRPRGVRLARTVGADGDTATKYAFLPVLTTGAFAGTGFQLGATISYGGYTWTIVARIEEDY